MSTCTYASREGKRGEEEGVLPFVQRIMYCVCVCVFVCDMSKEDIERKGAGKGTLQQQTKK
jgi:hypothetical protein